MQVRLYCIDNIAKRAKTMLVSELIEMLQQQPQHLRVSAFSHKAARELELYSVEYSEEIEMADVIVSEESVTLHFDV
jgi:hypothetical protein